MNRPTVDDAAGDEPSGGRHKAAQAQHHHAAQVQSATPSRGASAKRNTFTAPSTASAHTPRDASRYCCWNAFAPTASKPVAVRRAPAAAFPVAAVPLLCHVRPASHAVHTCSRSSGWC
eukprot:352231-Chlamydomonas_euryale.AAC.2